MKLPKFKFSDLGATILLFKNFGHSKLSQIWFWLISKSEKLKFDHNWEAKIFILIQIVHFRFWSLYLEGAIGLFINSVTVNLILNTAGVQLWSLAYTILCPGLHMNCNFSFFPLHNKSSKWLFALWYLDEFISP